MPLSFLLPALAALLQSGVPAALGWLVNRLLARVQEYVTAHPEAQAELDRIAAVAGGADPLNLTAAPDALKDWLRSVLEAITEGIDRPLVKRAFALLSAFVVDKLADRLWDRLFPQSGLLTAASANVHWSDAVALESTLLALVAEGRGTFTDAAQFPVEVAPVPEPAPAEGTGPELVFDTPPVSAEAPAAPVTESAPAAAPEATANPPAGVQL